ncbi:MAG TPA: hypothetical protein PKK96_09140 [Anaerolineales bacterium]|nr:hypothetical protein [Anaerolineales bacterium]HNQ96074.1 hypothetical protein [Anaerolineales bacterium]HNS61155.1 hypothetical protein [Anaerolineales bacterium]
MNSLKPFVCATILLALGLTACGTASAPTQNPEQLETVVAATLQAYTAEAPAGVEVSFNNVSFVIPNGLASGATPILEPAVGGDTAPWVMAPEHIVFTLTGYNGADPNHPIQPTIYVFPTQAFAEVSPGASLSIPELQALLASPSAPIDLDSAPGVPFFNAGQDMVANGARLNFQSGSGLRMISHFSQFPGPIIRTGQIYHYQGLTSDGKYYVIAILPVVSPLQSTADNPSADGINFPDYASAAPGEMDAYYLAVADKLNAADPSSFTPVLSSLDALIQSITISP